MNLINKTNPEETRNRYLEWWDGEGMILSNWGGLQPTLPAPPDLADPGSAPSVQAFWTDPVWRARSTDYVLRRQDHPGDLLPVAGTHIGPGSLAMFLGSEPGFQPDTVWYEPRPDDPSEWGELRFDPQNRWWKVQRNIVEESVKIGRGDYYTGMPDLIENLDILASLRGNQELLIDLLTEPDWVKQKLGEINKAWLAAHEDLYQLLRFSDGSSCYHPFFLWGPGRTIKIQCDFSAMIGPDQFAEFVAPYLREQCQYARHSLFHLDGPSCIRHLDLLLDIPELTAISWIPGAGQPHAGDPVWYDLYRRILDAGKSVQACLVPPEATLDLLNDVGSKGVYVMTTTSDEKEYLSLWESLRRHRVR